LWMGSSGTPISNLYGVAFTINYDASMVQPSTETITYSSNWLGNPGTNALKISKIDNLANTAYGAITRTDHMNMSGFGKIANFKFQIKSTFTLADSMSLSISSYKAIDSAGVAKTLTTQADTISVNTLPSGIKTFTKDNKVSVYPNPFNSYTTISFATEINNATVKIVDVLGKEVRTVNFSGKQLMVEKGELNAGFYFIKVISEQNVIAQEKIIIQ
jgi:hypothetical protein